MKLSTAPIHELVFASNKGDPDAQFVLAQKYEDGVNVPEDKAKAFSLYKKAAQSGHAEAQFRLALLLQEQHDGNRRLKTKSIAMQFLYRNLHGVSPVIIKDNYESYKWMKLAALQENSQAEFELANMLYYGQGCSKNMADARKWYERAAAHGCLEAFYRLGKIIHGNCYYKGTNELILSDPKNAEAFKWWIRAAENGHTLAQYEIAQMYEDGRGVKKDYREAAKWFSKAAANKHVASICQLARFAEDGKVDGQTNYSEAAKLYRLALSLGYDTAAYLLRLHKDNHISPNNDEELATWEQASKRSSDGIRLPGRHAG